MEEQEQRRKSFRTELARLFFIAGGVFLFILFFQPFPLDTLDYDDRLLYVTGFGGITFLFGFIVLVLSPLVFPKWFKMSQWESGPPIFLNFILLSVTITAYVFYVKYVGNTSLSLYVIFKTALVCLLPIIILSILYKNKSLEQIIEILQKQNNLYSLRIVELEKSSEEEIVDIYSESKSDKISLKFKDIISVQSADNYIELNYFVNNVAEKKLIRNTLKNIEAMLVQRPEFIRCHRTSIINIQYVDKLERSYSGYSLKMRGLDLKVAISRQYLILIKDAISNLE